MLVEVCANSLESAINAEKAGADRIELCAELGLGGVTPSFGLLKSVREIVNIPIHVLIRPRSGDFTYEASEFKSMLLDTQLCVDMGFDGIVTGVLQQNLSLDVKRTEQLKKIAKHLKFTFHRAFDWTQEPFNALKQLEQLEVDYILTSGQQQKATEGIHLLEQLKAQALTCSIMPGSGINADNAVIFKEKNFEAIHLSGTKFYKKNANLKHLPMSSLRFFQEDKKIISDFELLKEVVLRVK